jgi:hypothetical protein
LALQSGYSAAKLYRINDHWLSSKPSSPQADYSNYRYLICDGTYIHRPVSLVVLMDAPGNKVIHGQYGVSESVKQQLTAFFQPLETYGLQPISCTVDGNPCMISVLRAVWPDIIIQRCLVHIQRQGLMWCRRNPKSAAAKKLRELFLKVTYIRTITARNEFIEAVYQWEMKFGGPIDSRPEKGRVFSDLKRARSMLLHALPDMFHYLDDPHIAFSTNGLEGYFSRVKSHYRQHRGLAKSKLGNYFAWYLFLKPK